MAYNCTTDLFSVACYHCNVVTIICVVGKETVKHVVGNKYGYLEDLLYPLFKATHLNYNLLIIIYKLVRKILYNLTSFGA